MAKRLKVKTPNPRQLSHCLLVISAFASSTHVLHDNSKLTSNLRDNLFYKNRSAAKLLLIGWQWRPTYMPINIMLLSTPLHGHRYVYSPYLVSYINTSSQVDLS